ncbi:MAG: tRNA (adenosine(37)-N6)-dimethylallyltransferase MiaA [Pseudomonadota bacterium]
MSDKPFVIFIMGPTASGKTDLAVHLHENLNCEIISVDSALVYRGMDIGTAKPEKDLLEKVPHRLIDICDPTESYSAARFIKDANQAIEEIQNNGKIPVLVGGTGLYFRSLEQGLAELPDANYRIRARLEAEAEIEGWQCLHTRLREIDPDAAARINENDPQRIQRALEVYEITGETMTALLSEGRKQPFSQKIKKIILSPEDRSVLHLKVKQRFLDMLESGLVEEVETLYQRGDLSLSLPSMRLVGYRQVWRYLDGQTSYEEMREHAIIATRQLAKRQITWCRSETDAKWHDPMESGILSKIRQNLEN